MYRQTEPVEMLYDEKGQMVGFFKNGSGLKLYLVSEAGIQDLEKVLPQKPSEPQKSSI